MKRMRLRLKPKGSRQGSPVECKVEVELERLGRPGNVLKKRGKTNHVVRIPYVQGFMPVNLHERQSNLLGNNHYLSQE